MTEPMSCGLTAVVMPPVNAACSTSSMWLTSTNATSFCNDINSFMKKNRRGKYKVNRVSKYCGFVFIYQDTNNSIQHKQTVWFTSDKRNVVEGEWEMYTFIITNYIWNISHWCSKHNIYKYSQSLPIHLYTAFIYMATSSDPKLGSPSGHEWFQVLVSQTDVDPNLGSKLVTIKIKAIYKSVGCGCE